MLLTNLKEKHPWFLNAYELAEELTLKNHNRIRLAHQNKELNFFKKERRLEMEIFMPLRGEFVTYDQEKLGLIDSLKVMISLYLNTFHYNTCFKCESKKQVQENTAESEPRKEQISQCKGSCQYMIVSENSEDSLLNFLFSFDESQSSENSYEAAFGEEKSRVSVDFDWKEKKKFLMKQIVSVTRHKNFIPKNQEQNVLEIDFDI